MDFEARLRARLSRIGHRTGGDLEVPECRRYQRWRRFFLIFIIFTFGIGLPLLLAEFMIGRNTGKEAVSAYRELAPGSKWHGVGYLGMATCSVLLSFTAWSAGGLCSISSRP